MKQTGHMTSWIRRKEGDCRRNSILTSRARPRREQGKEELSCVCVCLLELLLLPVSKPTIHY